MTTGLGDLQRQGRLLRRPDRTWLVAFTVDDGPVVASALVLVDGDTELDVSRIPEVDGRVAKVEGLALHGPLLDAGASAVFERHSDISLYRREAGNIVAFWVRNQRLDAVGA